MIGWRKILIIPMVLSLLLQTGGCAGGWLANQADKSNTAGAPAAPLDSRGEPILSGQRIWIYLPSGEDLKGEVLQADTQRVRVLIDAAYSRGLAAERDFAFSDIQRCQVMLKDDRERYSIIYDLGAVVVVVGAVGYLLLAYRYAPME